MKLFERKWSFPILLFCTLFGGSFAGSFLSFLPLKGDMGIYAGYLLSPIILLTASAVYYKSMKIPLKSLLPATFDVKTALKGAFAIAGFFAAAVLPAYAVAELAAELGLKYSVTVPAPNSPLKIVLSVIVLAVLPSLGEELFFRKAIHDTLEGLKPIQIALISGLVFALWHMNIAQLLHQFFLGVFLSLVMQKTKSIIYPILLHMINNLLAIFLSDTAFFRNLSVFGEGLVPAIILFFAGISLFSLSAFFIFQKKGRISMLPTQQPARGVVATQNLHSSGEMSGEMNGETNGGVSTSRKKPNGLLRSAVITLLLLSAVWIFVVIVSIMLN